MARFFFTLRRFFLGALMSAFNALANVSGCNVTGLAGGISSWPFSVEAQIAVVASAWRQPRLEAPRAMVDASACCYDALEHIGVLPVVVPEGELVEVEREVVFRDVMERPHDATLNERPEAINVVSVNLSPHIFAGAMADGLVIEPLIQDAVATGLVRGDEIDTFVNSLPDEPIKRRSLGVLDHLSDDIAFTGNRADHGDLAFRPTTPTPLVTMAVLIVSTDVGFVNLDHAGQLGELSVLHGGADTVTHVPSRPVGARADSALNLHGAHALLTLTHEVDHLEPRGERVVGVLEDRPDERREAVALLATFLALPRPRTSESMNFRVLTARTGNAIGPAQLNQVAFTGVLGGEPFIQLCECHHG